MAYGISLERFEVVNHAARNQRPEDGKELALREQIGLAGFPNHVGHPGHAVMDGQGFGLFVLHQAEQGADAAEQDAEIHQHFAADAAQSGEFDVAQGRNFDVRLTGKHIGCKAEQTECRKCPQ